MKKTFCLSLTAVLLLIAPVQSVLAAILPGEELDIWITYEAPDKTKPLAIIQVSYELSPGLDFVVAHSLNPS